MTSTPVTENDRLVPSSVVSNSLRTSSLRPQGSRPAPLGPRIRQSSTNFSTNLTLERRLSQRDSTVSRTSTRSRESTLYSPGPASPARSEHDLPGIMEQPSQPTQSPETAGKVSRTPSVILREQSLVASTASSPSPSPAPNVKPVVKPDTLIPPPKVTFESISIPWKGLPLDAALWTFDSRELQDIVSRAIRSSARESFIRLVSIKQLDETLPAELERLAALKATTQSKYKFNVHRRTMLLQALMSYCGTISPGGGGGGSGSGGDNGMGSVISRLTDQLSETTIECDKLSQELVQIVGQMSQIQQLLDVHWASALAIALRKLNGSYGKRTSDLVQARLRIEQLEAELEDAWKEAEKMAQEIDDLDNEEDSDLEVDEEGTIQIKKAEVVPVSMHNGLPSPRTKGPVSASFSLMNLKRTAMSPPISSRPVPDLPEDCGEPPQEENTEDALVHGPPAKARANAVTPPADTPPPAVEDDRASVHSKRSTRSVRSTKSNKSNKSLAGTSRVSLVTAARKRSVRTSLGSLRLPGHKRKISLLASSGAGIKSPSDSAQPAPPVPEIPRVFSPASSHPPSSTISVTHPPSFLDLGSRNVSAVSLVDGESSAVSVSDSVSAFAFASSSPSALEPAPTYSTAQRKADLEDISLDPIPLVPNRRLDTDDRAGPSLVMDDLYVMSKGMSDQGDSANVRMQRKSVDDVNFMASSRRRDTQSQTIPSIWLHADTPKTSAERVQSLVRSQSSAGKGKGSSSYSKLREMTRRYSLPFGFHANGSGKASTSSRSSMSKN